MCLLAIHSPVTYIEKDVGAGTLCTLFRNNRFLCIFEWWNDYAGAPKPKMRYTAKNWRFYEIDNFTFDRNFYAPYAYRNDIKLRHQVEYHRNRNIMDFVYPFNDVQ